MQIYNYLRYSDDFKICYGTDSNVTEDGQKITSYTFHPKTEIITTNEGKTDFSYIEKLNLNKTKVKEIAPYTFAYTTHLKDVCFPSTLKKLGDNCFYKSGVTKVDLSKTNIKVIPECCFDSCNNLSKILFPDTLTTIGAWAFQHCNRNLKNIIFPDSVTEIKEGAFIGCKHLTFVHFSKNLLKIDSRAFMRTNILEANLLETKLEKIGRMTFYSTPIRKCFFPKSLKVLGADVFWTTPLKEIALPFGLEKFRSLLKDNNIVRVTYPGINKDIIDKMNKEIKSVKDYKAVTFINDPLEYMICENKSFKEINNTISKQNKEER